MFEGVCNVWLIFLTDINIFISEPLNCSNSWTTFPVLMNNSLLESYYVVVFTFYAFGHLSCDIYGDVSSFYLFHENRYFMWHLLTPFNPIWYFWYTYCPPMCYQFVELSRSTKIRGQPCFSVKIWIISKKLCLSQQKMTGNDVMLFWIFWKKNLIITFKQVGRDSEAINGSALTNKTVIPAILNESQWCHW